MNIKEIIKKYYNLEIELLLAHVLEKPKEFLYMNPRHELTRKQADELTRMVKRRMYGEPMAYILGYKDFYGLRFKANKDVLIPRPETEMVVEHIVRACREQNFSFSTRSKTKILDIGTGSGCIAISLAHSFPISQYPNISISASDISSSALKIAKYNEKNILNKSSHTTVHDKVLPKIKFIKSDLLENIKGDFDIIIANLPYGWHGVKNRFSSVKDGLKFEPQGALYTKEKGLYEIRRLLEQVTLRKEQPKQIYLEFDPRQKPDLAKLIKKILPHSKTEFLKDLRKLWRYAIITQTSLKTDFKEFPGSPSSRK